MANESDAAPEVDLGDGSEKVKKKGLSGKVLVLFILLPILLIGGGGGGAFLAGVFDEEEVAEPTAEEEIEHEKVVVFYDLPEMLVNLNSTGTEANFLKIGISLELDDETVLPELEKLMPRVMDNFQVYLRELRREDLIGSAGIYRLKEELLYRVNSSIKPIHVNDVLFKEMLVQ